MVRTKLRNILNGRVLDNTFRSGEKVDRPIWNRATCSSCITKAKTSSSWT